MEGPDLHVPGDIASFCSRSTKHVSLMFHTGAALPDPSGVLGGEGDTSRVMRIVDSDDLATKSDALRGLVRLRSAPSSGSTPPADHVPREGRLLVA